MVKKTFYMVKKTFYKVKKSPCSQKGMDFFSIFIFSIFSSNFVYRELSYVLYFISQILIIILSYII